MLLWAAPLLFAMALTAPRVAAMSPPEPWHNHFIYSANGRYCAKISAESGRTSLMQVRRGWFAKKLWATPHYFERALISDDGSFLVYSEDWTPTPVRGNATVIEIYASDGTTRHFPLKLFVSDLRKLNGLGGGRIWRRSISLHGDLIQIESCDGRIFNLDAKSGKLQIQKPAEPQHSSQ